MSLFSTFSHPPIPEQGNEPRKEIYRDGGKWQSGDFEFSSPYFGEIQTEECDCVLTNRFTIAFTTKGNRGPILLMLHGVPSNRKLYFPLQRRLSPFCQTISIDMLGMGESSMPRNYGCRTEDYLLNKYQLVPGQHVSIDTRPWDWINDCFYIDLLMNKLHPQEKFIFLADDWGSGIATSFAARYPDRLLALINIDPIAFDGYPVAEIQAIGRASQIESDSEFHMTMSMADSYIVQVGKTMVANPGKVWNQYSLRDLKGTYADIDYESVDADSSTLQLKYHHLRVLADRAAILSPALLLPYDQKENSKGVNYDSITCPVLILWGREDAMMPRNNLYRFKYAIRNANVSLVTIPDAGHFAATDQPDIVCEEILNYFHRILGPRALGDIFLGFTGIWKGDEEQLIADLRQMYLS